MKSYQSFKNEVKIKFGYEHIGVVRDKVVNYVNKIIDDLPIKLRKAYTGKAGEITKPLKGNNKKPFTFINADKYGRLQKLFSKFVGEQKQVIVYVHALVEFFNYLTNKKEFRHVYVFLEVDRKKDNNYKLTQNEIDQLEIKIKEIYENQAYELEFRGIEEIISVEKWEMNNGLKSVKNKQLSLGYKFLEKLNGRIEEKHDDTLCVRRYIVKQLAGKRYFKKFDLKLLDKQIEEMGVRTEGLSTSDIEQWIKTYYPNYISFYAINPTYKVFHSYSSSDSQYSLTFIVNNGHIYPIENDILKKSIMKSKRLEMSEVKFSSGYSEYHLLENTENVNLAIKEVESDKIILINEDIEEVAQEVIKSTGYLVTAFKIRDGRIVSFQHPETHQIIESADNIDIRKDIADKLFSLYPYECFKFRNQSIACLGTSLMEIIAGKIPKSFHISEDKEIIDYYHTKPLIQTLHDGHVYSKNTCRGFDIKKSYSNAVLNMTDDYYVFSICDAFEKYDQKNIIYPGDYLVDSFNIRQLGGVHFEKQILPYNIVKYLLEKGFINKDKILLVNKASYTVSCKVMSEFMKTLRSIFPEPKDDEIDSFKTIANCIIGLLGKRFNTSDTGFITNDFETVMGTCYDCNENGINWDVKKLNDLYFVRNQEKTRLFGDHSQIYRQILGQGMVQLLELIELVYEEGKSKIIGYNTDSVFVQNPRKIVLDKSKYKYEEWKPKRFSEIEDDDKEYELEDIKEWNLLDDVTFNQDKVLINGIENDNAEDYLKSLENTSFCCIGGGGCQKSTLASKINKNSLVLCYSNKACDSFRQKISHDRVFTFDSYFYQSSDEQKKEITKIQVDEFSMLPWHWIKTLYKLKLNNPNLIFQSFGDPNQCKQVCQYNRYFEYLNKKVFRFLCGYNIMKKKYVSGSSRYDDKLNEALNHLLENKRLPKSLMQRPIMREINENIVKTNNKRDEINKLFTKEWKSGMRLIAEQNIKSKKIYNSAFYYLVSIKNNLVTIVNEKDDIIENVNKNVFRPSYACTVYKYQGSEIEGDVNIQEAHMMDLNEIYTALSRCKNIDQIHLKYTDKLFVKATEPLEPTKINYEIPKEGFIYRMWNDEEKVHYIGLTENTVEKRVNEHLELEKDVINKYKGKWNFETIAKVSYFDVKTLGIAETSYIRYFQKDSKYKLINTQKIEKPTVEIKIGNIDNKVKEMFKIEKGKGYFRIQSRCNGQKINIMKRFGPRITEEKAFEEITKSRDALLLDHF